MAWKHRDPWTRAPLTMALEPRIMFDAAGAATYADVEADTGPADASAPVEAAEPGEVVFIDTTVDGWEALAESVQGAEVVLLTADRPALEQIADHLEGRTGLRAVHIVSHGDTGALAFGSGRVGIDDLAGYGQALADIGDALAEDGDILLYGCHVGADGAGASFIEALAAASGADVAASDDLTGAADAGGDWVLESAVGPIEANGMGDRFAASGFAGTLPAPTVGTTTFFFAADVGLANGNGTNTATATDVGGTGWDFSATFTAATSTVNVLRGGNNEGVGLSSAVLTLNTTAATQSVSFSSNDGSEFDFQRIAVQSTQGATDYTITGWRNGVQVTGASQSGSLPTQALGSGNFTTIDVSGNANFQNVDRITITFDTPQLRFIFDDIEIAAAVTNAAPTLTSPTGDASFTENGGPVTVDGALTVSDNEGDNISGATVSITTGLQAGSDVLAVTDDFGITSSYNSTTGVLTLSGTTTAANYQAVLRTLTFNNTSENPSTTGRVITYSVTDAGSNSAGTVTQGVTVTAVNDAPVLAPPNTVSFYTEGGTAASILPGLTITDPDTTTFGTATVQVTDGRVGDVLAATNTGSFTASYDSATYTLTITGPGSLADLQTMLRSVTFASTSDDPTAGDTDNTRGLSIRVTEAGGGLQSNQIGAQVGLTSVNDDPTLTGLPASVNINEDTPTAVNLSAATFADADSADGIVTLSIVASSGVLSASTAGGVTVGGTGTGTLTLSGTAANIDAFLDNTVAITYTPAANVNGAAAATLTLTASDGGNTGTGGGGNVALGTVTVNIAAINDDPTGSGVPALVTFTEDTPGFLDLTGVTIGDVDSGPSAITVTISVTSGTLSVPGFPAVPGTGTGSLTLTGSLASVQANLATPNFFLYTPAANVAGTNAATLTLTIRDNGNTGAGGGGTITIGTGQIDITPVNDAPTLTGGGTLAAVNEDTTNPPGAALSTLGITAGDVDGTVGGYAIVGNTANAATQGVWQYSTNGGTNWFSVGTVADGATALALAPTTLVRFVPVANFNGAPPALTFRAIDSTYGGGFSTTAGTETRVSVDTTTNGGATAISAATATIATTITAVNDDPTGSGVPALVTFTEDTPGFLDLTGVTIGDVDSGPSAITVTISVTSGTLSVPGFPAVPGTGTGSLTLTGSLASVQANLATPNFFLYTPAANVAGTNAATLTLTIRDNGNTGLGGGGTIQIGTGQIDITPVNDAPTATTTGGSAAYTENAAGVPVDPGLTLADIDSTTLASATVSITGGFQAGADVLAFTNDGATMGNISASWNPATGELTLTSAGATATLTQWTAALRAVTFANGSEDPSTAARTVSFVVNDGGAASTAATRGVTVGAVNDAPTANPAFGYVNTGASTETGGIVTITNAMLNEGDPDDSGAGVTYTVTTAPTNGTLFRDANANGIVDGGEALGLNATFTQADIDNALVKYLHGGGGGSSDSFGFSVADGGENGSTPLAGQTFSITIAARPVVTIGGGTPAHAEDGTAAIVAPNLTLLDADSTNLTGATITITDFVAGDVLSFTNQNGITGTYNGAGVLTLSGTATLATYEAALRSITYSTTSQNPATGAGNTDRVISFTVTDGALNSTAQSQTVGVTNANDAPTLDATASPALVGIAEDIGAPTNGSTANSTLVSALLGGMTDVDTGALQGIAITGTSAQGTLWYSTDGGTTWTQVPAVSAGAALLLQSDARLYYRPAANFAGTITDALTFRAWDRTSGANGGTADTTANGGGTAFSTATDTVSVTVSNVNDAPVLAAGAGTTTFSGGGGSPKTPVAVAPALVLNDADVGETFATALMQITGGYVNGQDVLAFTPNAALFGNITGSFDAGSGTLTLTSAGGAATLAQMEAALRAVTYTNTSDTPNTADRTISIRVNDGDANSNVVTRTVAIETINDPPTITAPAAIAVTEDVATALTGIAFADPDAAGAAVTVTLSAPAGTFLAVGSGGVNVLNAGTGTLTLTGSIANINLFIANSLVSYTTAANAQGAVALTVTIDDGGNSGAGGPLTAQATVTLNITAVNDAPTAGGFVAGQAVLDTGTISPFSGVTLADPDTGQPLTVTVTLDDAAKGAFTAASLAATGFTTAGGGVYTLTAADAAAAQAALRGLAYAPAANRVPVGANEVTTFTVSVSDGVAAAVVDTTTTVVATSVNDAPAVVGSVPAQVGTPTEPFSFRLPANLFADADIGDAVTVTVEGLPPGLAFDPATGTISGTPTTQAETSFTIVGTDRQGARTTLVVPFSIGVPPVTVEPPVVVAVPDPVLPPPPPPIAPPPAPAPSVPPAALPAEDFGGVGSGIPPVGPPSDTIVLPPGLPEPVAPRPSFFLAPSDGGPGYAPGFAIRAEPSAGSFVARSGAGPISFTLPPATFVVENGGVQVLVGATLADGSPLPVWVEFDPATGTFTIDAPPGFTGELDVVITATLPTGEAAATTIEIAVEAAEEAPPAGQTPAGDGEPPAPQREGALEVAPAVVTAAVEVPGTQPLVGKPAFSEVVKAASRGAWATQGEHFLDTLIAILPAGQPSGDMAEDSRNGREAA